MKLSLIVSSASILLSCVPSAFSIELRGSNIKVDLVADDIDVQKKSSAISIKTFNKFIDDVTSTSPVLIEVEEDEEVSAGLGIIYPKVHITNEIPGQPLVTGKVSYASALCSNDHYSMTKEWTGPYRGGCLVTGITATITLTTQVECKAVCRKAYDICCETNRDADHSLLDKCSHENDACLQKCPPAGVTVNAKPYRSSGGTELSEFNLVPNNDEYEIYPWK